METGQGVGSGAVAGKLVGTCTGHGGIICALLTHFSSLP